MSVWHLAVALALSACVHDSDNHAARQPTSQQTSANDTPPMGVQDPHTASARPSAPIMQPLRNVSPYANDTSGLQQLATDLVRAATAGDRDHVRAMLASLAPSREEVDLVLTFDGQQQLGQALTNDAARARQTSIEPALGLARMTDVSIATATGEEIANAAPAAAGLDPRMRGVARTLRPLARFYRVTVSEPGTTNRAVLEPFVYAGTRWLYLPELLRDASPHGSDS
jgi:hypothetical protein